MNVRLGPRVARAASRVRSDVTSAAIDVVLTAGSYVSLLLLRFDGTVPPIFWRRFQTFLPIAIVVHLVANALWGLYREMWRHASVAEARKVLLAGVSAAVVLDLLVVARAERMPHSVVLMGALTTTALIGGMRFQSRLFAWHRMSRDSGGLRVLVLGAGEAAATIIRQMRTHRQSGLVPVAVLDDDPRLKGQSLAGVPVVGAMSDLAAVSARFGAHQALLAIPSAESRLVQLVAKSADAAGITLKVLPPVAELVGGTPSVRDLRDLRIEDLLGRTQVTTDEEGVRSLLAGRTVLITGAGGSIGSEVARQVAQHNPSCVVLLDNDDTHLHDAATLMDGVDAPQALADVRDRSRLLEVFATYRPDIVFHAAALKHVPILEDHPSEAVQTNVVGTLNVVDAAAAAGVQRLVFISTDKSVDPSSVMGASKWLGEQLVLSRVPPGARWCAVRFGNVLGSRGSVIPTFARQIQAGGPIRVTDPDMTRFFMSPAEAVQLVLQAAVFAQGGEVYILDMGEPVNILTLAQRMARLMGRTPGVDIDIDITGLRAGERLNEFLHTADEELHPTPHPSISHVCPALVPGGAEAAVAALRQLLITGNADELRRAVVAIPRGTFVRGALNGSGASALVDLT